MYFIKLAKRVPLAVLCAAVVWRPVVQAAAYSPSNGPIFNNPTGSEAQQEAITSKLEQLIGASPKGSVIRIGIFSLTLQSFADALTAAHKRGVIVRIVMDDHSLTPQWQQLENELGTDSLQPSYAKLCHGGCLTGAEGSALHAKVYLFSTAGSAKRVAVVSSSNPTRGQQVNGWNNAYVSVGDSAMYAAYVKFFDGLVAGSTGARNQAYYWTAQSGQQKAYFSPRADTGSDSDTMLSALGNVQCGGVASGYGSNGRTSIKVDMHLWTGNRLAIAKKLWQLDDAGCEVKVLYYGSSTSGSVLTALQKAGGKNGNPQLLDTERDSNGDGVANVWTHNKIVLINGVYGGNKRSKVVFTGSHNFTYAALYQNSDILLKLNNGSDYDAYNRNFATVWDTSARLPQ